VTHATDVLNSRVMAPGRKRVEMDPARYDDRWAAMAMAGEPVHGEADLIASLLEPRPGAVGNTTMVVLDAGCGTGRVAIELARRGYSTVGVDVDPTLLARAREKAPALGWVEGDLAALADGVAPGPYDAVVLAGNVMTFVARGTEGQVLATVAARTAPGGIVVAGFQLSPGRVTVAEYDDHARAAGLVAVDRWSTWDQAAFDDTSTYVVAVDRKVDPTALRSSYRMKPNFRAEE
jgi:SAM-dependent methyltransferase